MANRTRMWMRYLVCPQVCGIALFDTRSGKIEVYALERQLQYIRSLAEQTIPKECAALCGHLRKFYMKMSRETLWSLQLKTGTGAKLSTTRTWSYAPGNVSILSTLLRNNAICEDTFLPSCQHSKRDGEWNESAQEVFVVRIIRNYSSIQPVPAVRPLLTRI